MHVMQCVFESLYGNRKVLDEPYLRPVKTLKLVIYVFLKGNIINLNVFQTATTLPDKSITNILEPINQSKKTPQNQKSDVSFFGK